MHYLNDSTLCIFISFQVLQTPRSLFGRFQWERIIVSLLRYIGNLNFTYFGRLWRQSRTSTLAMTGVDEGAEVDLYAPVFNLLLMVVDVFSDFSYENKKKNLKKTVFQATL